MKKTLSAAAILLAVMMSVPCDAAGAETAGGAAAGAPRGGQPRVQIAVLLDTSGSMDGLINQARSRIWQVVNEFTAARRDGQRPLLQVALYEYGNDGIKTTGWVRRVLDLTDDLDRVSEKLFALTTNGGHEFCGQVIQAAVDELDWSADREALKLIFIAGNEPFTQGPIDYRKSCAAAIARGIVVNTVYCGESRAGVDSGWKDGALLADGRYASIDQDAVALDFDAPQDTEIARLGNLLNDTYVPYGAEGTEAQARQSAQDVNALKTSASTNAQRMKSKASGLYRNASWDLVDAVREGKVRVASVKAEDLPENMRTMAPKEREAYVASRQKQRTELQEQLKGLSDEREKYVAKIVKEKQNEPGENLDSAMTKAVREQAGKKRFLFE